MKMVMIVYSVAGGDPRRSALTKLGVSTPKVHIFRWLNGTIYRPLGNCD